MRQTQILAYYFNLDNGGNSLCKVWKNCSLGHTLTNGFNESLSRLGSFHRIDVVAVGRRWREVVGCIGNSTATASTSFSRHQDALGFGPSAMLAYGNSE